jgi:hypothetical protein
MQQHEESFRPNAELMTAAAQPTPLLTLIASAGQFMAHAPHSMQASRFWIRTEPLFRLKTSWGQTNMHMPQPAHFSWARSKVTTSLR